MIRSGSLSDLLKEADTARLPIEQHAEVLENELKQRSMFRQSDVKNELDSDLKQIQDYIINLSRRCLTKLNEWNNMLMGMDTEINEFSGLIQRVKADQGIKIMSPLLCEGGEPFSPEIEDNQYSTSQFNFPNYQFEINMTALDKVGHAAIQEQTNPEAINTPLISKIPAGAPKTTFWSAQPDFFIPSGKALKRAEDSAFKTSFSNFYGFSPYPPDLNGEQSQHSEMDESMYASTAGISPSIYSMDESTPDNDNEGSSSSSSDDDGDEGSD
ncbi:hypothetical protein TRFO_30453 [Tritrichomonas foetus]|uniref:Uncharacterized protein n=1 Tax=Tritrichomonas foetus TaxID=1144522 RepID=A0A1J4JTK0_9EUKA|nr:hypothetical protein TRFO_30453 [Tritrichomonas foetus]|eukprot:OHT02449.1 hypothetical protein TRFO_30453 [Tritrichomonas foetus]